MIRYMDILTIQNMTGLQVIGVGKRISNDLTKLQHFRSLQDYALVFLLEGHGSFQTESTGIRDLNQKQTFLLFPSIAHLYGPHPGESWKEIWVIFNGRMVEDLQNSNLLNQIEPIRSHSLRRQWEIETILHRMVDRTRLSDNQHAEDLLHLTADLWLVLMLLIVPERSIASTLHADQDAGYDAATYAGHGTSLRDMMEILDAHSISDRNIPEYFFTSSESYHTLRKRFLRASGISPLAYMNRMRIEKAKEMLIWTDLNINEIAQRTGFFDPLYFSRMFKKHVSLSPSDFRSARIAPHQPAKDSDKQ